MPRVKAVHTIDSFNIKNSPGHGIGSFAKTTIQKGATIGYYVREIIRERPLAFGSRCENSRDFHGDSGGQTDVA